MRLSVKATSFSCIVKCLCLVDRPFLVVSCLKKNKRWDFTEQLWLKIAVRAQGAFFKLWPKSHQFLPNKSDSHCPRGGFRFKPIWNLTFYYSSEKKKQKRRLSSLLRNICTKRQPLQTALFLNAMLTIVLFFFVEYEGWGYWQNWKKDFKQKVRF